MALFLRTNFVDGLLGEDVGDFLGLCNGFGLVGGDVGSGLVGEGVLGLGDGTLGDEGLKGVFLGVVGRGEFLLGFPDDAEGNELLGDLEIVCRRD